MVLFRPSEPPTPLFRNTTKPEKGLAITMADDTTASIIHLVQPGAKRGPQSAAARAKAYRQRKRQKAVPALDHDPLIGVPAGPVPTVETAAPSPAAAIPAPALAVPAVPARRDLAPILLTVAALGLGVVGVVINGWFARSLGSSESAGWLFLAIGVAADLVAMAVPSASAMAWQARQRGTALAGWAIWAMTFAFALTAGVGFAAVNISDVTASRASRITPAVVTAQEALNDAMASRDRECKGGVGKFCREREAAVLERRAALDAASRTVEQAADPQTEAAAKIVTWLTFGTVRPSGNDFAMIRLLLLALLPQLGGILLMVGRARKA